MAKGDLKSFTTWQPAPGWLVLLPSRLPDKVGELILPESYTKKNNSGICIGAGYDTDYDVFGGKECFFPAHSEYQIIDSDTSYLLYIVAADIIILTRVPPEEIACVSRKKPEGLAFATITHNQE